MAYKVKSFGVGLFLSVLWAFCGSLGAADSIEFPIAQFGGLNDYDSSLIIPSFAAQDLLNVDITPSGRSVKKRKGYGIQHTLTYSTSVVHGVHNFFDSYGNQIQLFGQDVGLKSSTNGGTPIVLVSSYTLGATYQCVDSEGFAYCANSSRNPLIKTNGSSWQHISMPSTPTMVAISPERLIAAGFGDSPNRIDFSAANDFTSWTPTTGGGTNAWNFIVTSPGSRITHITYAFGRLMWFKDSSFGYIMIGSEEFASDWQNVTVSNTVGTSDNSSVYFNGILYFRGQDAHFYSFDGSNLIKLSRDITTLIKNLGSRSLNSYTQTTQSDWASSSYTAKGWLNYSMSPGSVILDTASAPSSFGDTTQANFNAGTCVNLSTTSKVNSLELSFTSTKTYTSQNSGTSFENLDICTCLCNSILSQNFLSTSNFFMTGLILNMKKTSGYSGDVHVTVSKVGGGVGESIGATISNSLINTTQGDVEIDFSTFTLLSNTTYAFSIMPEGHGSNDHAIQWYYDTSGSPYSLNSTSSTYVGGACGDGKPWFIDTDTRKYRFNVLGREYNSSGTFTSQVFDIDFTSSTWLSRYVTLTSSITRPGNTAVTFQTLASTASNGSGSYDAWHTISTTSYSTWNSSTAVYGDIGSEFFRYFQVKATLTSTSPLMTPSLDNYLVYPGEKKRPSGTIKSVVGYAPNITSWDAFNPSINNEGSQSFYIRSSPSFLPIDSTTYSWTAINSGQAPSISTGAYFQIRDDISITYSTQNPSFDAFTQYWYEGTVNDKVYGMGYDNAIWWAVTYSTISSGSNNRILKWNIINNEWTLYDIPSNGFFVRNDSLYFGGSNSGTIYKFGDVDSDNLSAINAYWKSKDFVLDSPFTDKEFNQLSIYSSSVQNSSMTVTYTLNKSSSTAFTYYIYDSSNQFRKLNKNLSAGRVGNTFNIKFGNNEANQPFEVFGINVFYRPKPWTTTP